MTAAHPLREPEPASAPEPRAASPLSPAALTEDGLRRLHAYWQERCAGREMPARADISPTDIIYVLGNVLLVDVEHDPLRFRIRLHGTRMVERAGYDLTGRYIDELPSPEFREATQKSFAYTVNARKPCAWRQQRMLDNRWMNYETLMLPLSSDGQTIDMLLISLIYLDS